MTPEDMQAFQGEALVYPKELEGKLQAAVYREDGEQIRKQLPRSRFPAYGRKAFLAPSGERRVWQTGAPDSELAGRCGKAYV